MARSLAVQRALSGAFAERGVGKAYVAVVQGTMVSASDVDAQGWSTINLPIGADWERRPMRIIDRAHGKASQTRWRTTAPPLSPGTSRLELQPLTGRTHQLRVHLSAMGHPILGDALYGDPASAARLLLHATALRFTHPVTGKELVFFSAAPF